MIFDVDEIENQIMIIIVEVVLQLILASLMRPCSF